MFDLRAGIVGPAGRNGKPQATGFWMQIPATRWWLALLSLPLVLAVRWLAFRNPEVTEQVFSQGAYPIVARVATWLNGWLPVPLAEIALVAGLVVGVVWLKWWWKAQLPTTRMRRLVRLGLIAWCAVAVGVGVFLVAWGFHYARPPLRERLALDLTEIRDPEVLALGQRFVLAANAAALLCWAALEQGDRVGGMVFNDHEHIEVRPRRSRTGGTPRSRWA